MKHYKLAGWPDLPTAYHRMAYRRMLHAMSQRYTTVPQLIAESGLARSAVVDFVDLLEARNVVTVRESGAPDSVFDSMFGNLRPIAWIRRTLGAERLDNA